MGRPAGPKSRCGGVWTEARYTNFVKGLLRSGSGKWAPKQQCIKKARVSRGIYTCSCCGELVTATIKHPTTGKRTKNILADHVIPIIDPAVGFTTWDDFIEGLFCEEENFQAVCYACHKEKTKEERDIATARKRREKLNGS